MREQLTGHAYSSAKEKREKKGARDSKRNELHPGATCLAICITLQVLQGALSISVTYREGEKGIIFWKIDFYGLKCSKHFFV